MPAPTAPTVTLLRLSFTSFRVTIDGDPGVTHTVRYRKFGDELFSTWATTLTGDGTLDLTGLTSGKSYQVYVVSDGGVGNGYSLPTVKQISLGSDTDSLLAAIKTKYLADALVIAAIPGGIWEGEVPESAADSLPYAYLDLSRISYLHYTEGSFELCDLDFHIYAVGAAAAQNAAKTLKNSFDWCTDLTFSEGSCTQFMPTAYEVVCEMVRYRNTNLIYRAIVSYEAMVQRPNQ